MLSTNPTAPGLLGIKMNQMKPRPKPLTNISEIKNSKVEFNSSKCREQERSELNIGPKYPKQRG